MQFYKFISESCIIFALQKQRLSLTIKERESMKKVISICAVLLLALGVACAKADRPIKVNEMPQEAQAFLKTHFPNAKISFAKVDDELLYKEYEVMLADGVHLEFDSKGERHLIMTSITVNF